MVHKTFCDCDMNRREKIDMCLDKKINADIFMDTVLL